MLWKRGQTNLIEWVRPVTREQYGREDISLKLIFNYFTKARDFVEVRIPYIFPRIEIPDCLNQTVMAFNVDRRLVELDSKGFMETTTAFLGCQHGSVWNRSAPWSTQIRNRCTRKLSYVFFSNNVWVGFESKWGKASSIFFSDTVGVGSGQNVSGSKYILVERVKLVRSGFQMSKIYYLFSYTFTIYFILFWYFFISFFKIIFHVVFNLTDADVSRRIQYAMFESNRVYWLRGWDHVNVCIFLRRSCICCMTDDILMREAMVHL